MTTYTDEELQAIVEGARERSHWVIGGDFGSLGWYEDFGEEGETFLQPQLDVEIEGQFILDAIRALPYLYDKWQEEREKNRRLQIFLDEAEQFMVNDSNQAKILEQLKEQTELVRKVVIK